MREGSGPKGNRRCGGAQGAFSARDRAGRSRALHPALPGIHYQWEMGPVRGCIVSVGSKQALVLQKEGHPESHVTCLQAEDGDARSRKIPSGFLSRIHVVLERPCTGQ